MSGGFGGRESRTPRRSRAAASVYDMAMLHGVEVRAGAGILRARSDAQGSEDEGGAKRMWVMHRDRGE